MVGTFGPLNAFRVGRSCKDQTVVCVRGSEKNYLFDFFIRFTDGNNRRQRGWQFTYVIEHPSGLV